MGDQAVAEVLTRADNDAALIDLGDAILGGRELIVGTGADRVGFLHRVVTGNIAGTPVGAGCRSALLTTKGQVVSDMLVFVRADDVWIVVAGGQGEPTAAALSRYAIMDDFAAAARPDFRLLALVGPAAAGHLAALNLDVADLAGAPLLTHADRSTAAGPLWLVRARVSGREGFWLGGSAAAITAVQAGLAGRGVPWLDSAVAEAARVAALEPRWGREITPDYFPMEVGLSGAIDYQKGCYLGQEPIVRIRDRGHINWRLVGLDLGAGDGAGGPSGVATEVGPDDRLETAARPKAGRITSAARLPDGRGVALALLHTSIPVGAAVIVRHGEAAVPAVVRAEAD
jgi:folate-binding protein YgfZ